MQRWAIVVLFIAAAIAAKIPLDATEAHREADAVLYPRLVAVMNEFALGHGTLETPGHLNKLNAQDVERWKATRAAWKNLDEAMKRAGY